MRTGAIEVLRVRVIIYHDNLFGHGAGSTEKLLRECALTLSLEPDIEAYLIYRGTVEEKLGKAVALPFSDNGRETRRPFRCIGMRPTLQQTIEAVQPDVFLGAVWDRRQFPYIDLPSDLPVIQISPFGAFCDGGKVVHVCVSGRSNLRRLQSIKGVVDSSMLYNPLPVPPFDEPKANRRDRPCIVFGRCGRADPQIFDPISLEAFARIERRRGNAARYVYVAPPPQARAVAVKLGIRNIEFREWLSEPELDDFYREIDVFAHARRDGETVGIALVEAMLRQNPVITHRSRFNNEHLPLADFVAESTNDYVTAMERLIDRPEEINRLGTAARKRAARLFDRRHVWPEFIELVRRAPQRQPKMTFRRRVYGLAAGFL